MNLRVLLTILALFWVSQAHALDLQITDNLHITLPESQRLAHFSGVLIIWDTEGERISHRYLSAKNYLGVDMQGLLPAYFCHEFMQAECPPLPNWLRVLAGDSARVAKLKQGKLWVNEAGGQRIYAHYLDGRGSAFLPEANGVHVIEYKGAESGFERMLNSIRELND